MYCSDLPCSKHPADVLSKEGAQVLLDNKLSRGTLRTFLKSACALFEQSKCQSHHHSVRSNSWPKRPTQSYRSYGPNRSRRESPERRCGTWVERRTEVKNAIGCNMRE